MSLQFQVPGFQSFVIEAFATNCCLYSVLDKSFDFHDANTVSLLISIFSFIYKSTNSEACSSITRGGVICQFSSYKN